MAQRAGAGRLVLLSVALVAAGAGAVFYGPWGEEATEGVVGYARENTARRRADFFARSSYDAHGFRRMHEARPGEWLWVHPEAGQTFAEFVTKPPLIVEPDAGARTFVIQPLTPLEEHTRALLEPCREYTGLFFTSECRLAEPVEIPEDTYRAERDQYDASALLDFLAERRPEGALCYTGLCDRDLITDDLDNYLFGLGRFSSGLGVYSFTRFHHPGVDETLYLERALQVLNHEIGHAFGLEHCIYFMCSMNGANHLPEGDTHPVHYCPLCLRKLQHCLGFDVPARYEALQAFYAEHGLEAEAEWVAGQLEHLAATGRATYWEDAEGEADAAAVDTAD